MKLHKFVASLKGDADKGKIVDDMNVTAQQLNEFTIPAYTSTLSANLMSTSAGFKSPWLQKRNREFISMTKTGIRGNIIEQTNVLLSRCNERLDWVRSQIEKQNDVTRDGLTYPVALLLQLYEATRFYINYSRKFLLLAYSYEAKAMGVDTTHSSPFTPAETLQIEQQFADFIRVTNVFSKHGNNIPKLISAVPDIVVDIDDSKGVVGVVGEAKLDPLRFNFGANSANPIWWYQSWKAERQHKRYVAAQLERQAIEMRLLQLKSGNTKDAATEKAIAYNEQRLKDANHEISSWEKEYGN